MLDYAASRFVFWTVCYLAYRTLIYRTGSPEAVSRSHTLRLTHSPFEERFHQTSEENSEPQDKRELHFERRASRCGLSMADLTHQTSANPSGFQITGLSSSAAQVELEDGRRARPRHRSSSPSSSDSSSNIDEQDEKDHDGHRPTNRELHESISRSRSRGSQLARPRIATAKTTGLNQPLSRTILRRDTILSHISSRPPIVPFSSHWPINRRQQMFLLTLTEKMIPTANELAHKEEDQHHTHVRLDDHERNMGVSRLLRSHAADRTRIQRRVSSRRSRHDYIPLRLRPWTTTLGSSERSLWSTNRSADTPCSSPSASPSAAQ